ncbi:MAG: hypothetical protein CVV27_09280 [Candidatus Melainabacteria bacterium HGW-Melainabacteria-1]|nr:MAG: hypothetical protein CVV27_09280 [Candidatus Melainabacteria bacterium HGW-Melainabacteria-1]
MRHTICLTLLSALISLTGCTPSPGQSPSPVPESSPSAAQAAQGQVTTLAGTGSYGFAEGPDAMFYHPSSVIVTPNNQILLLDRYNHRVRKISADGNASTLWGDGEHGNRDGGPGTGLLNHPIQLLGLSNGDLLIADAQNHTIRRLSPAGQLSTFAGSHDGFRDGEALEAQFNWPSDLIADADGNLYLTDRYNHALRKIAPDGKVSTLAGNGSPGYEEGQGKNAQFNEPMGLTLGTDQHLYVADAKNNVIRRVSLSGAVTTFAGSGQPGSREDSRLNAEFREPSALVFGPDGTLYVCDRFNHRIRSISPAGQVTTLAGNGKAARHDGAGEQAAFSFPYDLSFDQAGNLLVADYGNHSLRKITL